MGKITPLTLIYTYYGQDKLLARQIDNWSSYSSDLKQNIKLIIVDDGSPTSMQTFATGFNTRVFRINEDIPWNGDGARNLAMNNAEGWCLMTDIDHLVPQKTLDYLQTTPLNNNLIYQFKRKYLTKEPLNPHCNSFLMTAKKYWEIGGHDERLINYDKDRYFRQSINNHHIPIQILPCFLYVLEGQHTGLSRELIKPKPDKKHFNFTWREL